MTKPLETQALQDDLAFVERQIAERADPYDTVRFMWEKRREAILEQLSALEGITESRGRVALIFGGAPVIGSQEIKADFAAKALENYQLVLGAIAAEQAGTTLGERGKIPGALSSRLFIRDMVRGSVGFLLEELEPEQKELLASPIKEAIEEAARVLHDMSEEEVSKFDERIRQLSPRTVGAIKRLTKVLHDFGAETKIVGDEVEIEMDRASTSELNARLTDVDFAERNEKRDGILLGLFPERQQYEFKPFDGLQVFYGPVSETLDTKYLADPDFAHSILLKPVRAIFEVNSVSRAGRVQKEEWILQSVELI